MPDVAATGSAGTDRVLWLRNPLPATHLGGIALDREAYGCEDRVEVCVTDPDLNTDPNVREGATARLVGPADPNGEEVELAERGVNRAEFCGEGVLSATDSAGVLRVAEGDALEARYEEAPGLQRVARARVSDCTAPGAVGDLRTTLTPGPTEIALFWTAPGDDPNTGGAASRYDIRYTTAGEILTEADFEAATVVGSTPIPKSGGSSETFTVRGLQRGMSYWFALRSTDEKGNVSAVSNSPLGVTLWEFGQPSPGAGAYRAVRAGELDGDGRVDLVAASSSRANLFWYSAPVDPLRGAWVEHAVGDANSLVGGAWGFDLADLDGDGDEDAVVISSTGVWWFERASDPAAAWARWEIGTGLSGAWDVEVEDIDQDGDPDVVVSDAGAVRWYEAPEDPKGAGWTERTIVVLATGSFYDVDGRGVEVADLDADGDPDVVVGLAQVGTFADGGVYWYQAPADPRSGWTRRTVDAALEYGRDVRLADMDGDADEDVVVTQSVSPYVVWEQNPGDPNRAWVRHDVAGGSGAGTEQASVADLDGDGDLDLVVAQAGGTAGVYWYESPGDPNGAWVKHLMDRTLGSPWGVWGADIDGDGMPDVAATGSAGTDRVLWLRNPLPLQP
jgi:hypothetical protein